MKKNIINILFVSIIFFTAATRSLGEGVRQDIFQKNFNNGNFASDIACKSQTGYYFVLNTFLYYLEKDTMDCTIVCGKLECDHRSSDCNAFVENDNCSIRFYDNSLYYCLNDYRGNDLYSMALDGTQRRKIHTLGFTLFNASDNYLLHKGFLYYMDHTTLCRVSLSNRNSPVLTLGSVKNVDENSAFFLWADKDMIYIFVEDEQYIQCFYQYNLDTQQFELIWTAPDSSVVGEWHNTGVGVNGWYITDETLYFYLSENGVWKCELSSGVIECIAEIRDPKQWGFASFDEKYIYINTGAPILNDQPVSEYCVYVYDYNGNQRFAIPYGKLYEDDLLVDFSIVGSDGDYLFFGGASKNMVEMTYDNTFIQMFKDIFYYVNVNEGIVHKVEVEGGLN